MTAGVPWARMAGLGTRNMFPSSCRDRIWVRLPGEENIFCFLCDMMIDLIYQAQAEQTLSHCSEHPVRPALLTGKVLTPLNSQPKICHPILLLYRLLTHLNRPGCP